MDKMKLQNILLKLANDVLDLEKSDKTLGEPIDEATQAILDLLDKQFDKVTRFEVIGPAHRELTLHDIVVEVQLQDDGRTLKVFFDYPADVRKVIKEV